MNRILVRLAAAFVAMFFIGRTEAQTTSSKPMVKVTLKSMKEVLTKFKDLTRSTMEAAGQGAMWPLIEGSVDAKLGKEGEKISGLDTSKPIGFRIMYKAPTPPAPIDGDILIMLPTNDASNLLQKGLPSLGLASPTAGEGGVTSFTLAATKALARESNGYVCLTVADAGVISTDRLPKPSDVVGTGAHDLSIAIAPSALPEQSIREFYKLLQARTPGVAGANFDTAIQQVIDTDTIEYNVDLDPAGGKVVFEIVQAAKAGTRVESMFKGSKSGPLKSSIGISPTAVFSAGMRGDSLTQYLPQLLKLAPPSDNPAIKMMLELAEEVAKGELEDLAISVSSDGAIIIAAALGSTAGFELKSGEIVDSFRSAAAKKEDPLSAKMVEQTKRDALKIGETSLSRVWIPLPEKKPVEAANVYFGTKEKVAIVVLTFDDSTKTMEASFKQPVIDDFPPASATLKFKPFADAMGVAYSGNAELKVESKGGNPMSVKMEIPVKAFAELEKAGMGAKLKERFGK